MHPNVRRAVPADLPALLDLARAYCAFDGKPWRAGRTEQAFRGLLDDDRHGVVLVVERVAGVCGYAVVTWGYSIEAGGIESLLDEIYVADRGAGLGSLLLAASLDAARGHGALTMFLETESHNARVRGLYERHGFRIEDSVWMSRRLR